MTKKRADVQLTPRAEKDLGKLKHDEERAAREIRKLEDDPFLGHTLRGSLSGARSLEFSLRGGGEYRAIYIVHENSICIIFIVGAHENIYKRAESRYEALRRQLGIK